MRLGLDLVKGETEPALHEFIKAVVPPSSTWTPEINVEVRVGGAADLTLESAHRNGADLVVMGTHGLGGFRKLLLGSTTERVLRRTSTALLAVPLAEGPPAVMLASSGSRLDVTRIVMATDFSEASATALEWATDVAQRLAVPLVLAHIVASVAVPAQWQSYVTDVDAGRVRETRARLDAIAHALLSAHQHHAVVAIGRPADAIASIAHEHQAGLIVVGLTGQGEGRPFRPGSIAYRVACVAHVPVLVVPAAVRP